MTDLSKKVSVIIRSVGERTVDLCRTLLTQQVPAKNVQVIQETPFTAAISKGFEIGIDYGLPWTLICDADLLIGENAVQDLVALAEQEDEKMFHIQGYMLDKLICGFRSGGIRIYRTAYLKQALTHIPSPSSSIRPESATIRQTTTAYGYTHIQKKEVFSIHDYEQYFHDIYRKAFVHTHKHRKRVFSLYSMWHCFAQNDPDYQVALWGLEDGLSFRGSIEIDVRKFSTDRLNQKLGQIGWQEKSGLSLQSLSSSTINRLIQTITPPPEYWVSWYLAQKSNGQLISRLNEVVKQVGWSYTISHLSYIWLYRIYQKINATRQSNTFPSGYK